MLARRESDILSELTPEAQYVRAIQGSYGDISITPAMKQKTIALIRQVNAKIRASWPNVPIDLLLSEDRLAGSPVPTKGLGLDQFMSMVIGPPRPFIELGSEIWGNLSKDTRLEFIKTHYLKSLGGRQAPPRLSVERILELAKAQ